MSGGRSSRLGRGTRPVRSGLNRVTHRYPELDGYAESVTGTQGTPLGLDVTTPNVARMYDYYLGGKDNFEPDRIAAEKVLALVPGKAAARTPNIPVGRGGGISPSPGWQAASSGPRVVRRLQ